MIKIDDEYLINANDKCYQLEIKSKIKDKNSKNYGKETRTVYGYYVTIEGALNGYIKAKTRKYISKDTEHTLNELLEEIKLFQDIVRDIFEKI